MLSVFRLPSLRAGVLDPVRFRNLGISRDTLGLRGADAHLSRPGGIRPGMITKTPTGEIAAMDVDPAAIGTVHLGIQRR